MDTLGSRIRAARTARGKTQEQLAREAGITMMTVSNLERGATKNPESDTLVALASALGTTVDALVVKDAAQAEVA